MNERAKKILYILYQPYKWLFFIPFFLLNTVFFVSLGTVIGLVFGPRAASRTTGVWWARTNVFLTPMLVDVVGKEHMKKGKSYVVVSNHQSNYDIFILYGWLGIKIAWVMKQELRKIPVFGFAGMMGGNIYIDRSNPEAARASLAEAKKVITKGTSIVFFPEGTRSRTGELGVFKKGAFMTALDLGLDILPIAIVGTRKILPARTMRLFPGRAQMIIHKPVRIRRYNKESVDALVARVKDVIQFTLDRYRAQGNAPVERAYLP